MEIGDRLKTSVPSFQPVVERVGHGDALAVGGEGEALGKAQLVDDARAISRTKGDIKKWPNNPFLPDSKTTFSPDFLHFSMLFLNFQDLNMIAMPNSHLVLHKETLKQLFEK